MRRVLPLGLLVVFLSATLQAQSTNGSLTGRVTDPSTALIVDAKVTAISDGTNVLFESLTNGSAEYHLSALPPGTYHLKIEKQGFKIRAAKLLHLSKSQAEGFITFTRSGHSSPIWSGS